MGYLDNSSTVIEAILTKKGREILAQGGRLGIVKFALSDDEIDYRLWQEDHPLGSSHYGALIENLPMLEAIPDETQIMRYKLLTLPKDTTRIPIITLGGIESVVFTQQESVQITPQTKYYNNDINGYTAILHNSNYGRLKPIGGEDISMTPPAPTFLTADEARQSTIVVGRSFTLESWLDRETYLELLQRNENTSIQTQLTVIGNDTGATISIPVIYKNPNL